MRRLQFTQEQIIAKLMEQVAGAKTAEVCRKHGISESPFYVYKSKFGSLEVFDARRLKAPEDENRRESVSFRRSFRTPDLLRNNPASNANFRETRGKLQPQVQFKVHNVTFLTQFLSEMP